MRFDIVFYILGIICFILAVYIPFTEINLITAAFIIVSILFGLLFMAFGYSARPRKFELVRRPTVPIEEKPMETKPEEKAPEPSPPTTPQPSPPAKKLTEIKGIGPKRMAQLNALGVLSVPDLANYSAKDLAAEMKISEKIAEKWIKEAKDLLKETS